MTLLEDYKLDAFGFIADASLSQIVKLIKDANKQYYNHDNPIMTDSEYDILKEELENRDPDHKLLTQIADETHSKNKVKLPCHMGSMDKNKPGTGLIDKWTKKFKGPYILSDKLDGTSGLLILREDGKHMLFTRGNGAIGTDITSMLSGIKGIPDIKTNMIVRGELLISHELYEKNKNTYTNARAMINGLVGKKKITKKELENITFVSYEIVEPSDTVGNQMKMLKKLKFNTVPFKEEKSINETNLSSYFKKRKLEALYDIDGIIVTDNNKHQRNNDGNPKYAFAFKELLEDQIIITEITDIEWRISKDGLIKPRVHVKPTIIGGITITHVTGHNAKNVVDTGLGIGAKIKLTRAGEVIPYIVEVVKKANPTLPKIPYQWNETEVDFVVDKDNLGESESYDILVKNITYFFKKMEIKYVDESIIKKMIDIGLDNIYKIINAKIDDFLEIEGFQEKMATKVYTNIQNAIKDVDLTKVMTASNLFGHGLGTKKLALIINDDPNILKIKMTKKKFIEKIIEIDGFDTKTATQFVENIDKFKTFLDKNNKIKIKIITKTTNTSGKFANKKLIFTGFRDKQLESLIESEGGTLSSAVSGNTDYVVTVDKDADSSKLNKARELNIKIFTKIEFVNKFKLNIKTQDI